VNEAKSVIRESGAPIWASACVLAVVLLFVAGCSQVELEGRPLRQGEQTARVSVKNPVWVPIFGWGKDINEQLTEEGDDPTEITSVHFRGLNGAEGYEGYWATLLSNCGDFYLPTGRFLLEIQYYRVLRSWYRPGLEWGQQTSHWSDQQTVSVEAGKEYVITPAGFFLRQEWEKEGRPIQ